MSVPLRICQHTFAGGVRCQAPATRLTMYCRHHNRYHPTAPIPAYAAESLRSPDDLRIGLHRALCDHLSGRIDRHTLGQTLNLFAHTIHKFKRVRRQAAAGGPREN